jgi:hypothetical protein
MAAGDVPGPGGPASGRPAAGPENPKIIYPNGFVLSPYAEAGVPGRALKDPPRTLWHASPGSSSGFTAGPANPGQLTIICAITCFIFLTTS